MSVDFLHPGEDAAIDTNVPALEMRGIGKRFPGVVALDNVDFTLEPGKIHALMGENGAGKSTLIKIMAGVYGKDAGTIRMRGREVDIKSPRDSLKEGIKVVFQEIALISEFTVAENIFLEGYPTGRTGSIDWKKIRADSAALFNSKIFVKARAVVPDADLPCPVGGGSGHQLHHPAGAGIAQRIAIERAFLPRDAVSQRPR